MDKDTIIQQALTLFQRCSVQYLSNAKCSPLFSEMCRVHTREAIMELVKVNSNASFIPETGSSTISIVARNHLGHVFVSTVL